MVAEDHRNPALSAFPHKPQRHWAGERMEMHQIWALFIEDSGKGSGGMPITFTIQIIQCIAGLGRKTPDWQSIMYIGDVAICWRRHDRRHSSPFLLVCERLHVYLGPARWIGKKGIWNVHHDACVADNLGVTVHFQHSK
jgi:hypothetical protein